MNEETLKQLCDQLVNQNISFGECNICITFRNKLIQKYAITSTKVTLVNATTKYKGVKNV